MYLEKLVVGGFSNIERVELNLSKHNALVALNNYGKSNVIAGITFGFEFIGAPMSKKRDMMAFKPSIPINLHIDKKPFRFEIEFAIDMDDERQYVNYGFSFDWIKSSKTKGQIILDEYLKIKSAKPDSKYKTYVDRKLQETKYLPSITGRCDKDLSLKKDELAINKLLNYDDLFYLPIITVINEMRITTVDTMENPDMLFRRINTNIVQTEYSLKVPGNSGVAFFIYSLKTMNLKLYRIFEEAIKTLLPGLDDFEPIEIDFREISKLPKNFKAPITFPDKFYDIRVNEKNSNQQTGINSLSSGSQKIFYVIAMAMAAELNKIPLITFEELENSIHPGLLQKLLQILDGILDHTKMLITSHSPYLLQYLEASNINIGIPNDKGLAIFKTIKKSKIKRANKIASEEGVSIGDLIFDQMIENGNASSSLLKEIC